MAGYTGDGYTAGYTACGGETLSSTEQELTTSDPAISGTGCQEWTAKQQAHRRGRDPAGHTSAVGADATGQHRPSFRPICRPAAGRAAAHLILRTTAMPVAPLHRRPGRALRNFRRPARHGSNPTHRRLERERAKAGSWLDFKSEQAAHPIGPAPSWSSWATACQLDRPGKGWISNPTLRAADMLLVGLPTREFGI